MFHFQKKVYILNMMWIKGKYSSRGAGKEKKKLEEQLGDKLYIRSEPRLVQVQVHSDLNSSREKIVRKEKKEKCLKNAGIGKVEKKRKHRNMATRKCFTSGHRTLSGPISFPFSRRHIPAKLLSADNNRKKSNIRIISKKKIYL